MGGRSMKKKLFLLALIPFFLMGCNKNNNQSSSPQSSSEEEIHSLIKLSEASIYIPEDRTYQLGLEIDESLKDYLVFWNIRDEDIASVEDGLITAKKVGNTICTVQVGTYTARCAVNVTNYEPEETLNITFDKKVYNLNVGDTFDIQPVVNYGYEIITEYGLTSDILDSSVVSMNDHTITALSAGTTDILLTFTYNLVSVNELIYVNVY